MPNDLVCGMQVTEKSAMAKSEYNGETYYFCGQECKQTFDEHPETYTGDASQHRGGHSDRVELIIEKAKQDEKVDIEATRHLTS